MSESSVRRRLRNAFRAAFESSRQALTLAALGRTVLIVAPHQDDETLACGGLIAQLRQGSVAVWVMFMTDGSGSHSHLMPPGALSARRKQEALHAVEILGVSTGNVVALDFADGQLTQVQAAAAPVVAEWLRRIQPEAVFVPCAEEPPADHRAARNITLAALQQSGVNAIVYEYPVWFWQQWPWLPLETLGRVAWLHEMWRSLRANVILWRDFRWALDIRATHAVKRAALDAHQTQMTRVLPDPRWLTLGEVAEGEFVAQFFQRHEVFRRVDPPQTLQIERKVL